MAPLRHDGPAEAAAYVANAPDRWARGRHLRLCVSDADDAVLGALDLDGLDVAPGAGELGWWVAPGSRGRGVGVTAARLGVRLAFEGLGLKRVHASIAADNAASRWVAAGAGLHLEATLKQGDVERGVDLEVWRLLRDEEPLRPQPEISAGALHLRPWRPSDAGFVFEAIVGDPEIPRWTRITPHYTPELARAWVELQALGIWAGGAGAVYAVCDSTTGDVLASIGLHRRTPPDQAELGYWSVAAGRGRGVVTEACRALIRFGRAELGVRLVEWAAVRGNDRSRAVAERLGFTIEAERRGGFMKDGVVSDDWIGSLLTAELG
jgi:RimJ/RimL family protein N-acetyltransferase